MGDRIKRSGDRGTLVEEMFWDQVVRGLEPGTMAGVREMAKTGVSWRATGTGDAEYIEAGEAREVQAV